MTVPTMATSNRLSAKTTGAALADSLVMMYWDASPMTPNEAKKTTETMPIIRQLNLLEKDLLFTGYGFV